MFALHGIKFKPRKKKQPLKTPTQLKPQGAGNDQGVIHNSIPKE
jgi:hypothetical protein